MYQGCRKERREGRKEGGKEGRRAGGLRWVWIEMGVDWVGILRREDGRWELYRGGVIRIYASVGCVVWVGRYGRWLEESGWRSSQKQAHV